MKLPASVIASLDQRAEVIHISRAALACQLHQGLIAHGEHLASRA